MEIYKDLTSRESQQFEKLLNSQLSKNKIEEISELVFLYLTKRNYLKIVYILIDSRHGFKESDISFLDYFCP